MQELITLYKPNGTPVKVNEESLGAAIALGWLEESPKAEKKAIEKQETKKKSKK